mgnify:FL=1
MLEKLTRFLKTNPGQTAFSVLGAEIHSLLFGSIAALCIFATLTQITDLKLFLLAIVSIPTGWGGVFIVSYFLFKLEAKRLVRQE